jgi:hypothetical protein
MWRTVAGERGRGEEGPEGRGNPRFDDLISNHRLNIDDLISNE